MAYNSSLRLPPTFFIESDKALTDFEMVYEYTNVLDYKVSKLLKKNRDDSVKTELKLYRLVLRCLMRLIELAIHGKESLIMKIERCVELYACQLSKQIRLLREYILLIDDQKNYLDYCDFNNN